MICYFHMAAADLVRSGPNVSILPLQCSAGALAQAELEAPFCRICHGAATADDPLLSPCRCRGTMAHVHRGCLAAWRRASGKTRCDICGAPCTDGERNGQEPGQRRWWASAPLTALALASSVAFYGMAALAIAAGKRQVRAHRLLIRQQQQRAVQQGVSAVLVGAALRVAAAAARPRRPPPR